MYTQISGIVMKFVKTMQYLVPLIRSYFKITLPVECLTLPSDGITMTILPLIITSCCVESVSGNDKLHVITSPKAINVSSSQLHAAFILLRYSILMHFLSKQVYNF